MAGMRSGLKTRPVELTRLRSHYRSLFGCLAGPHEGYRPSRQRFPPRTSTAVARRRGRAYAMARFTTGSQFMHYPRRISKIKRIRKLGFRARMKTRLGRKMISRKRRLGRRLAAA